MFTFRLALSTLQQGRFGPQRKVAEVTMAVPRLLQICKRCRRRPPNALICRTSRSTRRRLPAGKRRRRARDRPRCSRGPPMSGLHIAPATRADVPAILEMIHGLAEFERLEHLCVASEDDIERALFGDHALVEVVLAWEGDKTAGFALFFHNFSPFFGRRALYSGVFFFGRPFRRRGGGGAPLFPLPGRGGGGGGGGVFERRAVGERKTKGVFIKNPPEKQPKAGGPRARRGPPRPRPPGPRPPGKGQAGPQPLR